MKFKRWLKEYTTPAPGSPETRIPPKTGWSNDYLLSRERGLTPPNVGGFANTIENYYDPLDPNRKKRKALKKKPDRVRIQNRGETVVA